MTLPITLLPLLIKALPTIARAFQAIRDRHPDITNEEVFAKLAEEAQATIDRGEDWLQSHPKE